MERLFPLWVSEPMLWFSWLLFNKYLQIIQWRRWLGRGGAYTSTESQHPSCLHSQAPIWMTIFQFLKYVLCKGLDSQHRTQDCRTDQHEGRHTCVKLFWVSLKVLHVHQSNRRGGSNRREANTRRGSCFPYHPIPNCLGGSRKNGLVSPDFLSKRCGFINSMAMSEKGLLSAQSSHEHLAISVKNSWDGDRVKTVACEMGRKCDVCRFKRQEAVEI